MSIVEVLIVMTVMLVVVSIFSRMVIATSGLREVNRENAIAAEAARVLLERMRAVEFDQVWLLYNDDPADDPGGAGSAPGRRFDVPGLEPLPGAADGLEGEVVLPSLWTASEPEGAGALLGDGAGGAAPGLELRLREDLQDERLGLPRDLNGDSIIDDRDHRADYILLPVRVRVEWQGRSGPRRLEVFTMLGDVR